MLVIHIHACTFVSPRIPPHLRSSCNRNETTGGGGRELHDHSRGAQVSTVCRDVRARTATFRRVQLQRLDEHDLRPRAGWAFPRNVPLGEVLSAGAIPVFIHEDFVKPFPELIPWRRCSFTFPPEHSANILQTLRSVSPHKLATMQVGGAIYSEIQQYFTIWCVRKLLVYDIGLANCLFRQ